MASTFDGNFSQLQTMLSDKIYKKISTRPEIGASGVHVLEYKNAAEFGFFGVNLLFYCVNPIAKPFSLNLLCPA